jgi:hypothetical protein
MLPVQGVLILISSPNPLEVIEPGNRMLPLQLVESVVNCHLPVRSIRFSGCEHETVNRNKNNKELIVYGNWLMIYQMLSPADIFYYLSVRKGATGSPSALNKFPTVASSKQ